MGHLSYALGVVASGLALTLTIAFFAITSNAVRCTQTQSVEFGQITIPHGYLCFVRTQ